MSQISLSVMDDLVSKLLSERIPVLAFLSTSSGIRVRMPGFVDSKTNSDGIIVSVSGPPIDVERGFLNVPPIREECDFWYGEQRELPKSLRYFGDLFGESGLVIRFLDSKDTFALFFTL